MFKDLNELSGKRGRKRTVASVARAEPLNEYELKRERNIQRNNAVLRGMGILDSAQALLAAQAVRACKVSRAPKPAAPCEPSRTSHRIAFKADASEHQRQAPSTSEASHASSGKEVLLDSRGYFASKGKEVRGLEVDGQFRGWVDPAVCKQYGIASSEEEAASLSKSSAANFVDGAKMAGWSSIRIKSAKELRKNPNAYFYRHVAPHEHQAMGDWTEEEHKLFMRTAQEHGVGDKWGLFASYIPQRGGRWGVFASNIPQSVGYQCLPCYRETVIPRDLIFDPRFRLTTGGRAVFVG